MSAALNFNFGDLIFYIVIANCPCLLSAHAVVLAAPASKENAIAQEIGRDKRFVKTVFGFPAPVRLNEHRRLCASVLFPEPPGRAGIL